MAVRIQSFTTFGTLHGHSPATYPMALLASVGWFHTDTLAFIYRTVNVTSGLNISVAKTSGLNCTVNATSGLNRTVNFPSDIVGEASS